MVPPPDERTTLLEIKEKELWNSRSQLAKAGRSASLGVLGGSQRLGTFEILLNDDTTTTSNNNNTKSSSSTKRMAKSYSHSVDGSGMSYLTPTQMGRSELYQQIPFTAVFGLQCKERCITQAFANYAAELDVMDHCELLTQEEKDTRKVQASMIIMDELEFDSNLITTPLVFAIIVAAASQFLVGYNTGVMNAPESVVFPNHTTGQWSLAVAAFAIGGPFGAIIGGSMADDRGRRGALLFNTWIFLIGGIIQSFAMNMYMIIIARFIIGFASGYSSVLVPIYLGELAPPTLRGMLGTLTQFALVIGILIANLLAFPYAKEGYAWRVLFAVTSITAIIQLLCSPFLLESPRWLLNKDPTSLRARYIIKLLRGLRHDHEVETEVGHYEIGCEVQKSKSEASLCDLAKQKQSSQKTNKVSTMMILKEMMEHRKIRIMLLSCIVLQMAQQLSGINAVFYYSTSFFNGVIDNPLVGTTIVGAVNVLATYGALLLMDSYGRKTLILWSSSGMFISCIIIVLSLLGYFNNILALLAVNVYVIFFEIGLGPIPWLIVAEMFEAKYVAVAMSICSQWNWACNFIIGLVFPYMNKYMGPYSFVPFAIILLLAFLFTYFVLPETQGTTPDELIAEMTRKNSSSFVYHANTNDEVNINAIDNEWRKAMEQLRKEEESAMMAGTYDYGFQPIADSNGTSEEFVATASNRKIMI